MPIEVDTGERLADIARATIDVAQERGTQAVTLRAVAERLGRSTAYITNFVPSRAHLMANALEHARARWDEDRAAHLGERVGVERLAELARWMCTSSPEEQVLRSLWIEVIADVHGANRRAYEGGEHFSSTVGGGNWSVKYRERDAKLTGRGGGRGRVRSPP